MPAPSSVDLGAQPEEADEPLQRLLAILDIETIEDNVFRGVSPADSRLRVFGGQVAAQALVAAARTVTPGPVAHSLHAYFLRAGDAARPIIYRVDRIRDGRSFSTRRVVGVQGGKPIFNLQVSFQSPEVGYEHQVAMPSVPGPDEGAWAHSETLPHSPDSGSLSTIWPIEVRLGPGDHPYTRRVWLRAKGRMGADPIAHAAVFTYVSDLTLLGVTTSAHLSDGAIPGHMASLDQAIWFHRDFRVDDWLLYDQESPSATGGRGLAQGRVFTRDGTLAMSVIQEYVIRPPR